MTKNELSSEYFRWMCRLVADDKRARTYTRLLGLLDNTIFTYTASVPMDENRIEDGINLRYRFGRDCNYRDSTVATFLDCRQCSVLEMMIALAVRMEEHIMEDLELGDRTGIWFWGMVESLGLSWADNTHYDNNDAERLVTQFLNRDYNPNGKGGLFTVQRPARDMRNVEIWYQMNWYLGEIL